MADKKVIIACGDAISFAADTKFGKKAAVFPNVDLNGLEALLSTFTKKAENTDAALADLEAGVACVGVCGADMDKILDSIDRRTLIVAMSETEGLAFYGFSVNTKAGKIDRAITAQDVYATIAFVADLEIDANCTGGVLYQMLKDPNFKRSEIAKLKDAIARMESVISRDNREPWEKHDCA